MSYPASLLRQYHLLSEDHGLGGDTAYALAFTTKGEVVVRVTKHHAEQYKAPEVHDLGAAEFATMNVNGMSLQSLVVSKLNEILPRA
jgi:hypothetical protein